MKGSIVSLLSRSKSKAAAACTLFFMMLFIALPAYAEEVSAEDPHISILIPLFSIALFSLLAFYIHKAWFRDHALLAPTHVKNDSLILVAILSLGFLLRLYLAATNEGYVNDLNLFHYWGNYAFNEGLLNVYNGDFFLDYPPAYLYVLYVVAAFQKLLGITYGGPEFLILYKLPALIADAIAAYFIFKQAGKKWGSHYALGLTLLYYFNPVVLLDGAVWGQVDSIFTLLVVLSIGLFGEQKIAKASFTFAIAALMKPQAFIFMPIVLLVLLYQKRWKTVLVSAGWGFGTFLFFSLPLFMKGSGIAGLIELYYGTLSSYAYATLNAFNLYMLLDLNWFDIGQTYAGISLADVSIYMIISAVLYAGYIGIKGKGRPGSLYFIGAALIVIVFMFVTKMHERYMFSAIMLLLMAFIQSGDRRLLYLCYGFTVTNTLNIYSVLAFSTDTTWVPNDGVAIICSVANLILTLMLLYIGHDLFARGRVQELPIRTLEIQLQEAEQVVANVIPSATVEDLLADNNSSKRRWYQIGMSRRDWIIAAAVTTIYGVIALINLGSFDAPKTVWQPATNEDYIVLDLGERKQLQRIISFGGVGSGEYRYTFSDDGVNWRDEQVVTHDHIAVFSWKETDVALEARYMKLMVASLGFSIHEVALFAADSEAPLPLMISSQYTPDGSVRGEAGHLLDEQGIVPFHHTYRNGSYFDEIYHARTAYEHLEGIKAYESTHPPLGKLFIAIGIQLFGLSPFGWRIVGTLIGVLMLPIIYVMAKAILRKTAYATGAILLFAVDFMHFTQTRIATIDVYGVFFIMLMFYFMNQYARMNFYRDRLLHTFIPLGLAGLFFGLGIASKWIVFYGGAGLAIMLAIVLLRRFGEYRKAGMLLHHWHTDNSVAGASTANKKGTKNKRPDSSGASHTYDEIRNRKVLEQARSIRLSFIPSTISTLAVCMVCYIAVPIAVYALANIPVLTALEGGYTLKALVDYQVNMFNYHSNLVSSHPFSSTWWEWPFMKRPVWYYLDSVPLEGMRSTIAVLGNPIIWWAGLFTMLATTVMSIRRNDQMAQMLAIAYFSQYVPWMLVPRETFLYHYFAMVPFMIISIMYIFKLLDEKFRWSTKVRYSFIAVAIVLFIMFYPVLSGMMVPEQYVFALRWFPSWLF